MGATSCASRMTTRSRRAVIPAHDTRARGAAQLRLRRPGGVEDAEPLVIGETVERSAGSGAGGEDHGARRDLVVILEAHDVAPVAGLERDRSYGVAGRAPNLRAWLTARLVSSVPVMPAGKPR